MSDSSFRNPGSSTPVIPVKQNWLTWIILTVAVSARRSPLQRVVGAFLIAVSLVWLAINLLLWLALFIRGGFFAGIAVMFHMFLWNVIPYLIVHTWVNSIVTQRRWALHPERREADLKKTLDRLKNPRRHTVARVVGVALVVVSLGAHSINVSNKNNSSANKNMHQFSQSPVVNINRNPNVDYGDITSEDYYVFKPKSYNGKQPFGLIVYMSSQDDCQMPAGWADVLEKRHFLLVAPQAVGNDNYASRRMGLGIMGALAMMEEYKIDRSRVFVAGASGGARAAGAMAFNQPDLFKGTIQGGGSDFYEAVNHNHAINWKDSFGLPYGVLENISASDVQAAKKNVRFALVTGDKDHRRDNLKDLYENGFKAKGFKCELFDVPGLGHQDCNAETLNKVLDFLLPAKTKT